MSTEGTSDLWSVLQRIIDPLGPLEIVQVQGQFSLWPLLIFFLVAALNYLWWRNKDESFSLKGLITHIFPPQIYRHRTSLIGYAAYAVHGTLRPAFALVAAGVTAESVRVLLLTQLGEPIALLPGGWITVAVSFVFIFLVVDFARFLQHYLLHKVPVLWRLHRCHHSAEVLNPSSTFRDHPLSHVFATLIVGTVTGVATGCVLYFTGSKLLDPPILSLLAVNASLVITANYLYHSHMWISFGKWDHVFISPAVHQIHHSSLLKHRDKNMGSLLSIWDRLFGTLYVPKERESFPLGISDEECGARNPHLTVRQFFVEPVTTSIECLMRRNRKMPVAPIEVTVEQGRTYWWCACGLSKTQPFCDGSHHGTPFSPVRYRATETGTKWFCVCKKTQNTPFCDGTHNQL